MAFGAEMSADGPTSPRQNGCQPTPTQFDVGAQGLGAVLGIPSVGLAQTEDTTTTVVEESSETTGTTVTDETTETEKSGAERPNRGDGDCEKDEDTTSSSNT